MYKAADRIVMTFQVWRQTVAGWNLKAIQVFTSLFCLNKLIPIFSGITFSCNRNAVNFCNRNRLFVEFFLGLFSLLIEEFGK